jgi:hypothetical protein
MVLAKSELVATNDGSIALNKAVKKCCFISPRDLQDDAKEGYTSVKPWAMLGNFKLR